MVDIRLVIVHERIAALPIDKKHEAMRRASCSYSAPNTAIKRGGIMKDDCIEWPDTGERYPISKRQLAMKGL